MPTLTDAERMKLDAFIGLVLDARFAQYPYPSRVYVSPRMGAAIQSREAERHPNAIHSPTARGLGHAGGMDWFVDCHLTGYQYRFSHEQ